MLKRLSSSNYFSPRLCGSGIVQLRVNNWIEVSFCLPQKVHRSLVTGLPVDVSFLGSSDKCTVPINLVCIVFWELKLGIMVFVYTEMVHFPKEQYSSEKIIWLTGKRINSCQ